MNVQSRQIGMPFSTVMVSALQRRQGDIGDKTQTRRVARSIKVRLPYRVRGDYPIGHTCIAEPGVYAAELNDHGAVSVRAGNGEMLGVKPGEFEWVSRYRRGDIVWVREVHHVRDMRPDVTDAAQAEPPRGECPVAVTYKADGAERRVSIEPAQWRPSFDSDHVRWRPPMFMPKWASRIRRRVAGVRLERVRSITDADAMAEGMLAFTKDKVVFKYWPCDPHDGPIKCTWQNLPRSPREAFLRLFFEINERAAADPWVWVYELERVEVAA